MRHLLAAPALLFVFSLASASPAASPEKGPAKIEIASARVHLHDLGIKVTGVDVDLGPSPLLGQTRTIERAEIVHALEASRAPVPPRLPERVTVARKSRRLDAAELGRLVRASVEQDHLPKGATIGNVRAMQADVPEGFDKVAVELPPLPRRAGQVPATAQMSFFLEGVPIAKVAVPLEIVVPAEALVPDVAKGAPLVLLVRRGLVEVSVPGVASASADIGATVSVLLKSSGRLVRARIVDKEHAVSVEEP